MALGLEFPLLKHRLVDFDNAEQMRKWFAWSNEPKLEGVLLWHEFNLALAPSHRFIHQVCLGLEELFRSRLLQGRIYHLRDSWVGLYRLPRSQ